MFCDRIKKTPLPAGLSQPDQLYPADNHVPSFESSHNLIMCEEKMFCSVKSQKSTVCARSAAIWSSVKRIVIKLNFYSFSDC